MLWDDHGQPMCATQADEDILLEELAYAESMGWLRSGAPAIDPALLDPNEPPF